MNDYNRFVRRVNNCIVNLRRKVWERKNYAHTQICNIYRWNIFLFTLTFSLFSIFHSKCKCKIIFIGFKYSKLGSLLEIRNKWLMIGTTILNPFANAFWILFSYWMCACVFSFSFHFFFSMYLLPQLANHLSF